MIKRFGLGFIAGYVVGAHSGSDTYDKLADAARKVADLPGVHTAMESGRDRAREAARRFVSAARERGSSGDEELESDTDDEGPVDEYDDEELESDTEDEGPVDEYDDDDEESESDTEGEGPVDEYDDDDEESESDTEDEGPVDEYDDEELESEPDTEDEGPVDEHSADEHHGEGRPRRRAGASAPDRVRPARGARTSKRGGARSGGSHPQGDERRRSPSRGSSRRDRAAAGSRRRD